MPKSPAAADAAYIQAAATLAAAVIGRRSEASSPLVAVDTFNGILYAMLDYRNTGELPKRIFSDLAL
jgi:hypothetical protein